MTELRLEPLAEAHLADLEQLLGEEEVLRFTRLPDPPVPGYAAEWIERYRAARADGRGEAFAAVGPDGSFLGVALAPHIDRESGETELGYMVAPAARGRGVASEMLRQLTTWAFAEKGVLRATLLIDVANVGSQRVAVRAGYILEGVLRSAYFKQGMRADVQLWSRLPSDPEPDGLAGGAQPTACSSADSSSSR